MKLSARQCAMLTMILKANDYLTMETIAKQLSLSKRTILREFDKLSLALNNKSYMLESKSGYGIRFVGDKYHREFIEQLLEESRKKNNDRSPTGRETYILTHLLQLQEPVKIYTFARELDVTEATIGSDLNRCERWFSNIKIQLVRKPGVGIFIEADEQKRRRAMVQLLHEQIGDTPFSTEHYNIPAITQLFEPKRVNEIRKLIDSNSDVRDVFLSDRSYSAVVIHLYFILQRILEGAAITDSTLAQTLQENEEEVKLANRLLELMQNLFGIQVPAGELAYLSTILRSEPELKKFDDRYREQQARRIADKIILITETRTGVIIDRDNTIYEVLLRHLIPTISRLNLHMEIRNPMLNDIKKYYTELYSLAKQGVTAIEEELGVPVPDSEVGYIAIHLGAALEDRRIHLQRRQKLVICCPTGVISAKLLALRVEHEFSNITVVDVKSTVNLNYPRMKLQEIELIISTVPLQNCPLPFVVVSPFLLEEEKEHLLQKLHNCRNINNTQAPTYVSGDLETILQSSQISINTMLELLKTFFYLDGTTLSTTEDLVELVAKQVGENDFKQAAIARSLFERESYGSTITADGRCMLLHCRTSGISKLRLGVIQLDKILKLKKGERPLAALVMLAPISCPKQALDILSIIGCSTVEYPWFVDAICSGETEHCYQAIEQVLIAYYNNSIKTK